MTLRELRDAMYGKRLRWRETTLNRQGEFVPVDEEGIIEYIIINGKDNNEWLQIFGEYSNGKKYAFFKREIAEELIDKGIACDGTTMYYLEGTTETAPAGGIDWEGRTWQVAKALYLRHGDIDVVGTAKTFVERYRKEMEDNE